LQGIDQFGKRFVGTIFDLVPGESPEILVGRLWKGHVSLKLVRWRV
jgi:hypothetical protein